MISFRWAILFNRWSVLFTITVVFIVIYFLGTGPLKNPQSHNFGLSVDLKEKLAQQRTKNNAVHKTWSRPEEKSLHAETSPDDVTEKEISIGKEENVATEFDISKNETGWFKKKKKRRKKLNESSNMTVTTMAGLYADMYRLDSFQSLPYVMKEQSLNESSHISKDKLHVEISVVEDSQHLLGFSTTTANALKTDGDSKYNDFKENDKEVSGINEDLEVSRKPASLQSPVSLEALSRSRYPPLIVDIVGAFTERVEAYNLAISNLRRDILRKRGEFKEWVDVVDPSRLIVIWGAGDDFLLRLSSRPEIHTVILPWARSDEASDLKNWTKWTSLRDTSNILIQNYYQWIGSAVLCSWIDTQGLTKARWDAVYDRKCNTHIADTLVPRSLEFLYFNYKTLNPNHYWPHNGDSYPRWFYSRPPAHVFYVHIVQDAVVNTVGDVIAGGVKIVPYTCSHDNLPTIPREYPDMPVYREVFVLTQFWGASYFHKIIEVMPRLAPYLSFLRANPTIHIHAPEDRAQFSELLTMLGINPERIVTGIVRAKLVYLPQGTPCGFPQVQSIQILSKALRDYIQTNITMNVTARTTIILIRRSGTRRFVHHEEIQQRLAELARERGLNFTVFADNPSPSLRRTMTIFASALMVVAPHGAGLSNVVFSAPGTCVIEGVCNPPHVNMCFQMAAHVLGHRYYGLASRGGCESVIDVLPETIIDIAKQYLEKS